MEKRSRIYAWITYFDRYIPRVTVREYSDLAPGARTLSTNILGLIRLVAIFSQFERLFARLAPISNPEVLTRIVIASIKS